MSFIKMYLKVTWGVKEIILEKYQFDGENKTVNISAPVRLTTHFYHHGCKLELLHIVTAQLQPQPNSTSTGVGA